MHFKQTWKYGEKKVCKLTNWTGKLENSDRYKYSAVIETQSLWFSYFGIEIWHLWNAVLILNVLICFIEKLLLRFLNFLYALTYISVTAKNFKSPVYPKTFAGKNWNCPGDRDLYLIKQNKQRALSKDHVSGFCRFSVFLYPFVTTVHIRIINT